jgi:hypothetical protein
LTNPHSSSRIPAHEGIPVVCYLLEFPFCRKSRGWGKPHPLTPFDGASDIERREILKEKRQPDYVSSGERKRRPPVRDSRTKFDRWLDSCVNGKWVELTLHNLIPISHHNYKPDLQIFCKILEVDRYWIEVNIRVSFDSMHRTWLAKENILAARIAPAVTVESSLL